MKRGILDILLDIIDALSGTICVFILGLWIFAVLIISVVLISRMFEIILSARLIVKVILLCSFIILFLYKLYKRERMFKDG